MDVWLSCSRSLLWKVDIFLMVMRSVRQIYVHSEIHSYKLHL